MSRRSDQRALFMLHPFFSYSLCSNYVSYKYI